MIAPARCAPGVALLAVLAAARPARAQTMLDQEERLIDLHALLLDLPPVDAPGPLAPGQATLGLEVVGIPHIDGTTGTTRQITASDETPVYPRPRLAVGLPAPAGFRAFAALSAIPPVPVRRIRTSFLGAEAGIAWVPGALAVGLRAHVLGAEATSPVTDPATRDRLRAFEWGWDLAAGYRVDLGPGSITPYAGIGTTRVQADFRVTSDGVVLRDRETDLALHAGARLLLGRHLEAVAEWAIYPGRLVDPRFRLAYVFELGGPRR